ncbi:MAG: helix-turn-helix domain-containing protein [Dehalococcoidia bacterium]
MLSEIPGGEGREWLSLGEASRLLGVHQATLRLWADRALLPVYRTPGGHRRFRREDVLALTQRQAPQDFPRRLERSVIRRIHASLKRKEAQALAGLSHIDESARARLRLYGRRLVTVAASAVAQRRVSPRTWEEIRSLGARYGEEASNQGLSLTDLIQIYLFFRTMMDRTLADALRSMAPGEAKMARWRQASALADAVLQAMVEAYEARRTKT